MINFIKYNEEKHAEIWEKINLESHNSSFLSSLDWIGFQKSLGKETHQFLIEIDGDFVGNIYTEVSRRKIAKYAYVPYGPVISDQSEKADDQLIFKELQAFAKQFCREQNLNYFKIDPIIHKDNSSFIEDLGWKKSMAIGQAKDAWVTELGDDAETLLMSFKKDTRYYVNRARKNGVIVKKATDKSIVEGFIKLMEETKERQDFVNFNNSYYLKQWEYLKEKGSDLCQVYVAYYKDKPIAGALMNFYNGWVNYAHGASTSDRELSKLGGPYLLHYEIMKDAISIGYSNYNFWGIVPGQGFSMFKMKFPGEMVSYAGTFEVGTAKPAYYLNRLYDWWVFRNERY